MLDVYIGQPLYSLNLHINWSASTHSAFFYCLLTFSYLLKGGQSAKNTVTWVGQVKFYNRVFVFVYSTHIFFSRTGYYQPPVTNPFSMFGNVTEVNNPLWGYSVHLQYLPWLSHQGKETYIAYEMLHQNPNPFNLLLWFTAKLCLCLRPDFALFRKGLPGSVLINRMWD